jgi:guanylate kinase
MNKLFILVGPGGVGKDTILEELMKKVSYLNRLITCTTRKKRPDDISGKTIKFFSEQEFKAMIKHGDFLETDFHFGAYYGSRKKDLARLLKKGNVIVGLDINGARKLKKMLNFVVTIFIKVKSKNVVIERMRMRGMSEEGIKMKLKRYGEEMKYEKEADYVVVNDKLDVAISELKKIIEAESK